MLGIHLLLCHGNVVTINDGHTHEDFISPAFHHTKYEVCCDFGNELFGTAFEAVTVVTEAQTLLIHLHKRRTAQYGRKVRYVIVIQEYPLG